MLNKFLNKSTFLLNLGIIFFIVAFNFSDSGTSGWQKQSLPYLNNRPLRDMAYTDSLTAFGITKGFHNNDSDYIIKTTNAGNNWFKVYTTYSAMNRIIFLNSNTGFICGSEEWGLNGLVMKTTNGGNNWISLNTSFALEFKDMAVLNEDTVWVTDDNGFNGGIYRTNNGGINWFNQYFNFGSNPRKIYMFNYQLGFMSTGLDLWKSINGGYNWIDIPDQNGFNDMFFVDTLTGWKCSDSVSKTTDGGSSWIRQYIPKGGLISNFGNLFRFSHINKDTIWGCGGYLEYSLNNYRGILYYTSNGGTNWLFQIPDTSFGIPEYNFIDFLNSNTGWANSTFFSQQTNSLVNRGIHTTNGGDTIFYTRVDEHTDLISSFRLFQNYPNPFNPKTKIKYELRFRGQVVLKVYDVLGNLVATLVNKKQPDGKYEVEFDGNEYPSGVYFYSLFLDEQLLDTKKMILLR